VFLLGPRPFANGWNGSELFESLQTSRDLPEAFEPGTLFLQQGLPPFAQPVERLPFDYSIVDGAHPYLFRLVDPQRGPDPPGEPTTEACLGSEPAKLFAFSPRTCQVALLLTIVAGQARSEAAPGLLRVADGTRVLQEMNLEGLPTSEITIPIKLTAGINRLELTVVCQPAHPGRGCGTLAKLVDARLSTGGPREAVGLDNRPRH
jgi:hypothetical protein